jgi:hypothetical protein
MKSLKKINQFFVLGIALLGSILLPFACRQEKITVDESILVDTKLPSMIQKEEVLSWGGFPLPAFTSISQQKVDGKSVAIFTFPEGVKFVTENEDNTVSLSERGCYSCVSTCTKGCDVAKIGDSVGCSSCDASQPFTCTGSYCRGSNGIGHGFVDLKAGIEFITDENKDKIRFLATPNWDILSQVPEIAKALGELNLKYYGTKEPTMEMANGAKKGYKINLFGSRAIYYIPNAYFQNLSVAQARLESSRLEEVERDDYDDITCECQRGSGCTKERIKSGPFTVGAKCVSGGCNDCRMNW